MSSSLAFDLWPPTSLLSYYHLAEVAKFHFENPRVSSEVAKFATHPTWGILPELTTCFETPWQACSLSATTGGYKRAHLQ